MTRQRMTLGHLRSWLMSRDGIAHRDDLLRAGFAIATIRSFVRTGDAAMIRRAWVATPAAPVELITAARAGGRLTCISLARRRGWWMPEHIGTELHLHLTPGSGSARLGQDWRGVTHWTKPVSLVPGRTLLASTEDALAHIAVCQPFDTALVLWESAARVERLSPEALRTIPFVSRAARRLAASVTGLSDSGLETLDRLVLQIDGYEFHSSSEQRTRDIAHNAELRLRGYTVIRLSYAQIVHDWPAVAEIIRRAVAAGLHLA